MLMRGAGRGGRGLELLMLRRGAGARFMPGVWVFAGGVVDPGDFEAAGDPPEGLEPDEWAHRICGARELAEEGGVEVAADGLVPWSRWITPEQVPLRFDTRFYLALAPAHCRPEPDGVEMDEVRWVGAADALRAGEAGELELSFPTVRHLEMLVPFGDAEAALEAAAERVVEPILPRVVGSREAFRVLLPGDAGYD